MIDSDIFRKAFDSLPRKVQDCHPLCGLILGSGWGEAILPEETIARIRYAEIPGLGASTVAGHSGELLVFKKHAKVFMAFLGRRHWYEGVGWEPVLLPVELLRRCGASSVLLTNAAGAVSQKLRPGNLLLLRDHINTTGASPLQGPPVEGWGVRFPDLSEVYDRGLAELVHQAARASGQEISDGVYAFTGGPTYETPAEIRVYGMMGADAVGMSTVPEIIVARHAGMRVLGISCMTNMAAGILEQPLNHQEVLETGEKVQRRFQALMDAVIANL